MDLVNQHVGLLLTHRNLMNAHQLAQGFLPAELCADVLAHLDEAMNVLVDAGNQIGMNLEPSSEELPT